MTCPVCNGTGKMKTERHPQPKEPKQCSVCNGTGNIQEIKTNKQRITIIKPHGLFTTN